MLLEVTAEELGGLLTLMPDPAGLHLVGWLPRGVSDAAVAATAGAAGVDVVPLSRSILNRRTRAATPGALLLGYGAFDAAAIRAGIRRLRRVLQDHRR